MPSPTPGELYVDAMIATQRYMDGVRADQLYAPTPNTEWDVKQVANHIIGENLWAGELLHGKTIGLVGLGRIGTHVARRLAGWDVKLLAADPYASADTARHALNSAEGVVAEAVRRLQR